MDISLNTKPLDLAVERCNFHTQQFRSTPLIAVGALQRLANQLAFIALHFFL
jgi:hypothetical protein